MMFLFEGEEVVQPLRDLLQEGRIVFYILCTTADVRCYVAHFYDGALQPVQVGLDSWIHLDYLLHRLTRATHGIYGSCPTLFIAAIEQGIDSGQCNLDVLGM